jgi:hypothetical protein
MGRKLFAGHLPLIFRRLRPDKGIRMNLSYPSRHSSVKRESRATEGRIWHKLLSVILSSIPRVPPVVIFHAAQPLHPFHRPHCSMQRPMQ